MGEINPGLEANATRLQSATVDGQTYWFSPESLRGPDALSAFLLPNYDEYTVAYASVTCTTTARRTRRATRARTCRSDMCYWWMAR